MRDSQGRGAQQGAWRLHTQRTLVYPPVAPRAPSHPGAPTFVREVPVVAQPTKLRWEQRPRSHAAPLSRECVRSPASIPIPTPGSLQPASTYSSTVLPGGSLGAFLTNITLWDREKRATSGRHSKIPFASSVPP